MPSKPNKLGQFWQELKRRKVLRSLAIYAGTAFIILEAATIIFPRWGFPDWTIDLVLYLLILGAFITFIIAWIYDITPGGVHKTKPEAEEQEREILPESNAWKVATYISLVVIVAFIIFNIVPFNKLARAGTIDSVIILPFNNFTGDDQLDNMVSGMHSMLIGDLGRVSRLRVISPTTANVYKDADMSVPEIASELGVNGVIDLDVMCLGDSVCLQVKVISPYPEEKLLWIADYKVDKSQMLNLYSQITKQIADEVHIELSPEEEQRLAESRTVDPEALDAYLKGLSFSNKFSPEGLEKAKEYFQLAIDKDPDWADPYAGMAATWRLGWFFGWIAQDIALPKIYSYLNKAFELDPNSAYAYHIKARTAVWTECNWEEGEKAFSRSLELNPNDAVAHMYYSHLLMILRKHDQAVIHAQLGLELSPMEPNVLSLYAVVMLDVGDYQSAIEHFEKALSIDPSFWFAIGNLLRAYIAAGDYEKWIELWKKYDCWDDEIKETIEKVLHEDGFVAAIEEFLKVNEEFGRVGCQMGYYSKFLWFIQLKEYDKALDNLEKMFEISYQNLTYMATNLNHYGQLKTYPRYIALLEKMNLPLPEGR